MAAAASKLALELPQQPNTLNESGRPRPIVARKHTTGEPTSVISIPAKYGSADQSGLTYTVKPGANTYNIELP